jgi:microcystin-dependent protein
MKQIEDAAIVKGAVVVNDLILEPHGFATNPTGYPKINAGNVRGPVGPQGVPGEVTQAALDAAIAATRVPAGTILMWAGDVLPSGGYMWCKGGTADRTAQAALFAAIGTKYGVGNGTTTFTLPNFDNRFPVGVGAAPHAALNDRGGSKDAILAEHQHVNPNHQHSNPAHQHSVPTHGHDMSHGHPQGTTNPAWAEHTHGGQTNQDGAHNHYLDEYGHNQYLVQDPTGGAAALQLIPGSSALSWAFDVGSYAETHWHNFTTGPTNNHAEHPHTYTTPGFNGRTGDQTAFLTPTGEGATTTPSGGTTTTPLIGTPVTNANLPPFITVNFIIKT